MAVLIKGMEMPKDGCYLDLVITSDGVVRAYGKEDEQIAEAVELPDHGDLVDIDRMLDDFAELRDYDFASREYVVIPAERSEDE